MPLPSTLQTPVKPCNIAGASLHVNKEYLSHTWQLCRFWSALSSGVNGFTKVKKSVAGYTSKLVVFNHVESC